MNDQTDLQLLHGYTELVRRQMPQFLQKKSKELLVALIFLSMTAMSFGAELFSDLTFDAASKEAAASPKLILIDFYTTWCGPCKMLDKNTWTDAAVIELVTQKAIALKMDAEQHADLAKQYHIEAYPTVLLLKADGTEIDRLVGYRDPQAFIADFNSAMEGKDSVARAHEKLLVAGTNNPSARMQYAMALAQVGKKAGALEEYLWCYDHGAEADKAFAGVRGSYLVMFLKTLAQSYPPAKQALTDRRDAAAARVSSGTTDPQSVGDLVALNEALGTPEKTLAVYDGLPADSPAREVLVRPLTGEFLKAKRYADVLHGVDPDVAFSKAVEQCQTVLGQLGQIPKDNPFRQQAEVGVPRNTIHVGAQYFEALAGLKRNDEGRKLAEQILKFDSSDATRKELAQAAERADNPELAEFMLK